MSEIRYLPRCVLIMVKYKKLYLKYWGYGEQDFVPSEHSGNEANSIHHLQFKSLGGPDEIWNLMGLTQEEHDRAHDDPEFNKQLKIEHAEILRLRGYKDYDKILQTMR